MKLAHRYANQPARPHEAQVRLNVALEVVDAHGEHPRGVPLRDEHSLVRGQYPETLAHAAFTGSSLAALGASHERLPLSASSYVPGIARFARAKNASTSVRLRR